MGSGPLMDQWFAAALMDDLIEIKDRPRWKHARKHAGCVLLSQTELVDFISAKFRLAHRTIVIQIRRIQHVSRHLPWKQESKNTANDDIISMFHQFWYATVKFASWRLVRHNARRCESHLDELMRGAIMSFHLGPDDNMYVHIYNYMYMPYIFVNAAATKALQSTVLLRIKITVSSRFMKGQNYENPTSNLLMLAVLTWCVERLCTKSLSHVRQDPVLHHKDIAKMIGGVGRPAQTVVEKYVFNEVMLVFFWHSLLVTFRPNLEIRSGRVEDHRVGKIPW